MISSRRTAYLIRLSIVGVYPPRARGNVHPVKPGTLVTNVVGFRGNASIADRLVGWRGFAIDGRESGVLSVCRFKQPYLVVSELCEQKLR